MNRVNEQLGLYGTFGQNLLRIHTDLQAEKTANVTPQPAMKMNDRMHFAHTLIFFLYLLPSSDKSTFLSSLIGKAGSLWLIAKSSWEYCSAFLKFSENILKRLSAFPPPEFIEPVPDHFPHSHLSSKKLFLTYFVVLTILKSVLFKTYRNTFSLLF